MKTHGEGAWGSRTPEFIAYWSMITRCENHKNKSFARYGGRGIRVCKRWRTSYEFFLADVGRRPSLKHSLDRFPNQNGNYEPGNVRWATSKEQARNTSGNTLVTLAGRTQCIAEWAESLGISPFLISLRLRRGRTSQEALSVAPLTKRTARGSRVGTSTLTEVQVMDIKKRISAGEAGVSIARRYGVRPATVSAIKHGRNWKHIQWTA